MLRKNSGEKRASGLQHLFKSPLLPNAVVYRRQAAPRSYGHLRPVHLEKSSLDTGPRLSAYEAMVHDEELLLLAVCGTSSTRSRSGMSSSSCSSMLDADVGVGDEVVLHCSRGEVLGDAV